MENPVVKTARPRSVECPKCGEVIPIGYMGGRKPLGHSVNLICDTLKRTRSVKGAAEELACSRGYIYKELKKAGLTAKEVIYAMPVLSRGKVGRVLDRN